MMTLSRGMNIALYSNQSPLPQVAFARIVLSDLYITSLYKMPDLNKVVRNQRLEDQAIHYGNPHLLDCRFT